MQAAFSTFPDLSRALSAASLMFDLELESDQQDSFAYPGRKLPERFQELLAITTSHAGGDGNRKLWIDALQARENSAHPATGEVDILEFCQQLADAGYYCWIRTGTGISSKGPEFAIKHTFVVVAMTGIASASSQQQYVIVDPSFKEQFQVAAAAEEYKQLLGLLPEVFVGSAQQIRDMVRLLCEEVEKMFADLGFPCPPWRQYKAMVQRWLVNHAEDVSIQAHSTLAPC